MPESTKRNALTEAVFFILLALHEPMHGYGIMQYIERVTDGRVLLGAGTLYGALNTLLEKRWIRLLDSEGTARKKEYLITNQGREVVKDEMERLLELIRCGRSITGGGIDETERL
ncbi:MAG: PadR family transcriptional regulator [Clostridiales bacterium]|nr:MAG: PadR family transcriptional regulator [Clostridiales bacterium]